MGIVILLIAGLAGIVFWWLSTQRLGSKPWLEQGAIGEFPGTGATALPPGKLGLGVLVAVIAALFALFLSAYVMRMQIGDWSPLPKPRLLWVNTGVLVLSSAALHWATRAAGRGERDALAGGLLVGAASALGFVVLQLLAWRELVALGYGVASGPAGGFFYLLTAVHAIHLLGGVAALALPIAKMRRDAPAREIGASVELCALYWHFLLIVWIVLFAVLLLT
jgi:cytochrome c oxidase subunit 3